MFVEGPFIEPLVDSSPPHASIPQRAASPRWGKPSAMRRCARFEALRPRLQHGVVLAEAARAANVSQGADDNLLHLSALVVRHLPEPHVKHGLPVLPELPEIHVGGDGEGVHASNRRLARSRPATPLSIRRGITNSSSAPGTSPRSTPTFETHTPSRSRALKIAVDHITYRCNRLVVIGHQHPSGVEGQLPENVIEQYRLCHNPSHMSRDFLATIGPTSGASPSSVFLNITVDHFSGGGPGQCEPPLPG